MACSYPSGPFTEQNCLGGRGGSGFMACRWIEGQRSVVVKALDMWWEDNLRGLQVTYDDDTHSDVFGRAVREHARINFAPGERITSLTLWASADGTRIARIHIKTSAGQTFDEGNDKPNLQERSMEVGSGVLVGMVGRHGWDIDMLGAVFLRSPVGGTVGVENVTSSYPSGPFTPKNCIGGRGGSEFMTFGWNFVVKALDVWWDDNLRGLQVTYADDTSSDVFGRAVCKHARIDFAPDELITSLTLWANAEGTRIARICIKTSAGQTFDKGNDKSNLQAHNMEVGSGVLVGMVGRHGSDIDMLGAVFLSSFIMSLMLMNCSNCRRPLQLPPGATATGCFLCQAVTTIQQPQASSTDQHHPPTPAVYQHPPPPPPNPFQPHNHLQYTPTPPHPGGAKKAVVVGIQYKNTQYELKGCLNDAKCMQKFLRSKFNFPEASIIMLTEEERDPVKKPTKHNIRMALFWLVQGCKAGDSLVFHFSGHGSQQENLIGDEIDGMDETILPVDFETQGMIVDDDINMAIVRPLPPGVKLHAIIDACHSGTVLDLPWLYRLEGYGQGVWEDQRSYLSYKGTNGGEAYSFSGCDDDQLSADTTALSEVTSTGAMTFCFIQAVERSRGVITYLNLLNDMRHAISTAIKSMQPNGGGLTPLASMLLGSTAGELTQIPVQEPQLSAHDMIDVNKLFSL